MTEFAEDVRRVAAAAGVAPPVVEVWREKRLAILRLRPDGARLFIHPALLGMPRVARLGIIAHELAHVARRDPVFRRWLFPSVLMALLLVEVPILVWLVFQLFDGRWWALPLAPVIWLAGSVGGRILILAIRRRQEYAADSAAAAMLGGADPVVAYLDWLTAHNAELPPAPLPVKLWNATHPSNAARRAAILRAHHPKLS